ncbi:hypothetical protein M407DRAFT_225578 [Tulasnella calospora MUT 4182]|uniref:Uncharacterized protein n=1 Tax=Tulasnella calospora MUT 4182 TaxID=1051891 RepID=A0A0C3PUB4_9AGAM|nr:hypothetical protein M407DRAFT_225578 [Tulasnella calospora MUT 4182]
MLGFTCLGLDEARAVVNKWLQVVPVGEFRIVRQFDPSSSHVIRILEVDAPSKGYGCHFVGRQPTATCANFSQRGWIKSKLQPEGALPVRTLSALSQSQEVIDSARGERAFTTVEAVWALLVDVCRRYGLRHFAVTSATHIALSAFKPYMLMYWMRYSMCSFSEQWNNRRTRWFDGHSRRRHVWVAEKSSGARRTWKPPLGTPLDSCRSRWIKKSGNEMVRVSSQGIKRRFEDRDSGGEDVAVYQEVVQDGPITPAGQRRWVHILTRKRYLELGHHVIEVDGSLCVAINAAQGNMDTMGAFPVTPTATDTDTTDTENSLTGGEYAATTMFSSGSSDRSSPPEGARKRKIPYRACRKRATYVAPQAQQQQQHHHVTLLLPSPPSAGGSRASSRRFSGAIRITKSLPKKKGDILAKSVTFQKQDDGDDSVDLN